MSKSELLVVVVLAVVGVLVALVSNQILPRPERPIIVSLTPPSNADDTVSADAVLAHARRGDVILVGNPPELYVIER